MDYYKAFWIGWLIIPAGLFGAILWTLIKISVSLAIIANAMQHFPR